MDITMNSVLCRFACIDRGKSSAISGRRASAVVLKQQLIVDETSDGLYYGAKSPAKKKLKRKHSLVDSIGANKPSSAK